MLNLIKIRSIESLLNSASLHATETTHFAERLLLVFTHDDSGVETDRKEPHVLWQMPGFLIRHCVTGCRNMIVYHSPFSAKPFVSSSAV
jgi:hypothetical protein